MGKSDPGALTSIAPPAGMNTAVMRPLASNISYAPQPFAICRWAMALGKSGVVAQPSNCAFGVVAGLVQSFAAGKLTHDPDVADSPDVRHVTPTGGVMVSVKVGAGVVTALDEPSSPPVEESHRMITTPSPPSPPVDV